MVGIVAFLSLLVAIEAFLRPTNLLSAHSRRGVGIGRVLSAQLQRAPSKGQGQGSGSGGFNLPRFDTEPMTAETIAKYMEMALNRGDISGFVHFHLKMLAEMRPALSGAVIELLEQAVDRITSDELPRWMWCLGKLGISMTDRRHAGILMKSMDKLSTEDTVDAIDMGMLLTGVAKAGVHVEQLSADQLDGLSAQLEETVEDFTPSVLASSLTALSKIGVNWFTMPDSTQSALWASIDASADEHLSARDAAAMVKALADLGLDAKKLTEEQSDMIIELADMGIQKKSTAEDMDLVCQHVSPAAPVLLPCSLLPALTLFADLHDTTWPWQNAHAICSIAIRD